MTSLDDLKTEQEQLIRHIKGLKDGGPEFPGDPLTVERAGTRLAVVNKQIAALEESTDHGGWEDR